MPTNSHNIIYQLKVSLRGARPPIWRRLLVPDATSLYKLHQTIQIAMGWGNEHLHQFIIEGEFYGDPALGDYLPSLNEHTYPLSRLRLAEGSKFTYEYDFGDSWQHQILVEKILPAEPSAKYPLCTKGKRACPPEDIGGVWGYEGFLEAMRDPKHEEHDNYLEWYGDEFDPEEFDIEAVNRALKTIR